jgi:hypothetical protein
LANDLLNIGNALDEERLATVVTRLDTETCEKTAVKNVCDADHAGLQAHARNAAQQYGTARTAECCIDDMRLERETAIREIKSSADMASIGTPRVANRLIRVKGRFWK